MIVASSAGQSAAGKMITGAASINVPGAIGSRAKTPRPRAALVRISTEWLETDGMRPHTAASRKKPNLNGLGRLARVVHAAGGWRRRLCGGGRRYLRPGCGVFGFLPLFLHASLECLDALREIAHYAGQLSGTEQNEDNGQDHNPMHQTEGTHCDNPGTVTDH